MWGPDDLFAPRMPGLDGAIEILGTMRSPAYDLFLIGVAFGVLGGLWLLFRKTRFGVLLRAATEDRQMVAALGIDQRWLFTAAFVLGAALAGLGGRAADASRQAASLSMDLSTSSWMPSSWSWSAGWGRLPGRFVAAVLISELLAFGLVIFPPDHAGADLSGDGRDAGSQAQRVCSGSRNLPTAEDVRNPDPPLAALRRGHGPDRLAWDCWQSGLVAPRFCSG